MRAPFLPNGSLATCTKILLPLAQQVGNKRLGAGGRFRRRLGALRVRALAHHLVAQATVGSVPEAGAWATHSFLGRLRRRRSLDGDSAFPGCGRLWLASLFGGGSYQLGPLLGNCLR